VICESPTDAPGELKDMVDILFEGSGVDMVDILFVGSGVDMVDILCDGGGDMILLRTGEGFSSVRVLRCVAGRVVLGGETALANDNGLSANVVPSMELGVREGWDTFLVRSATGAVALSSPALSSS